MGKNLKNEVILIFGKSSTFLLNDFFTKKDKKYPKV